jgi:hypothetical protein
MVTRTKLELPVNQPVNIELIYDEPVIGDNQYGQYYMYAVKSNGSEFAFFAPLEVHNELKNLRHSETAVITKLAAQRGSKLITKYVVESKSARKDEPITVQEVNSVADESKTLNKRTDKYFEIMLSSYQDALLIQEELNGMVDVTRIAITLFIARSKTPYSNGN